MMQVLISAGHSATDPGAVNEHMKLTEAKLALDLRDSVAAELRRYGVEVVEDGRDAENLPLAQAIKLVKGRTAVELHFNAGPSSAHGVEAISLPPQAGLARALSKAVASVLKTRVRGSDGWIDQSKSARGKLGFVQAGGIILEVAFISNDGEIGFYLANKGAVAKAIAATIAMQVKE